MPRGNWKYIGIGVPLVNVIDEFLKSEDAKMLDIKNRQRFVNHLILRFFEKYKEATGIDYLHMPKTINSIFDLMDNRSKKMKK